MDDLSHSEVLKLKILLAQPRLHVASRAFWASKRFPDILPEYLYQLYCAMRATVPLMAVARERAEAMANDCPVAARLVPYFTRHMREETGHDVWMLEDLESLGLDQAAVEARIPAPEVAALIGTLYYWVNYAHPVSLLAYFAVTEGNPPSAETVDSVARRWRIPRKAFRTVYKHAVLDVRHGQEVFRVLDGLPLTEQHEALLGLTALASIEQLTVLIERLLADVPTARRSRSRARHRAAG
jgi:hypothetical protein